MTAAAMQPVAARLEVTRRRADAPHPDECPKLRLHGVLFGIPPRREAGVSFRFDGDGAHVTGQEAEPMPEVRAIADAARIRRRACPRCGRVLTGRLTVDPHGDVEFLELCATLAGRLLRRHYTLTDDELAVLLAFDAQHPPDWLAQVVQWALIGRTEGPAAACGASRGRRRRWWKRLLAMAFVLTGE